MYVYYVSVSNLKLNNNLNVKKQLKRDKTQKTKNGIAVYIPALVYQKVTNNMKCILSLKEAKADIDAEAKAEA